MSELQQGNSEPLIEKLMSTVYEEKSKDRNNLSDNIL